MRKTRTYLTTAVAPGFTLIELLIVVAIIGILGAIAIPAYRNYISSSKLTAAKTTLEQFPVLLESFRAENGKFPFSKTYSYTESDTGSITSETIRLGTGMAATSLGAGLSDFHPRPASSPKGKGIMFDYSLTITGSGTTSEKATFSATGVTGREAEGIVATGSYK